MFKHFRRRALPLPINLGLTNDDKHNIFYLKSFSENEFLMQIKDLDFTNRHTILFSRKLNNQSRFLVQSLAYLNQPRVLITTEKEFKTLYKFKKLFPFILSGSDDLNNKIQIDKSVIFIDIKDPLESLVDILLQLPASYHIYLYISLPFNQRIYELLLYRGFTLLLDRDPSYLLSINQIKIFDYIIAEAFPGSTSQYIAESLWMYQKQSTHNIANIVDGLKIDVNDFKLSQINNLVEAPILSSCELSKLENEHKLLFVDRLCNKCYIVNNFIRQEEH